ncbi:hypothetical protein C0Q70_18871 [Pomacea canaliculata]|uniref:Uncharacterized protein n=1 Tax=Pomacea canaliculata TaxID=400727 RepID=A0A2T7NHU3_POMCA|nr:hypothetical protein C0Q70_18871 [Pomacea canaliculata]
MYFKGASSSYAEIPYSKGELDASMDFSWTMLLKPDSLSGNGVILEYWDGVGGIRVKQVGSTVVVEAQDVNNFTYNITIQKVFTETNGATDWIFLGVCYIYVKVKPDPGFKIYNEYYTKTGSGYTSKVDNGTVLRGKGPVRLGGSVLSTQPPFAGSISCLRFHTKFINKFAVDYASQCDPKGTFTDQYNLTEYTRDYDSTSTTILTTATTAKTSAADETTSGALPVTTTPTVVDIPQVRETCYRLIRQLSGGKISQRHVLAQNPVNSLGACANQCALFPGCAAISVQKSVRGSHLARVQRKPKPNPDRWYRKSNYFTLLALPPRPKTSTRHLPPASPFLVFSCCFGRQSKERECPPSARRYNPALGQSPDDVTGSRPLAPCIS